MSARPEQVGGRVATPVSLADVSGLRCEYRIIPSSTPRRRILIVRFIGPYRDGSEGKPDARFMAAMGAAGMIAWEPDGIIIDLTEFVYEWGDDLDGPALNPGAILADANFLPAAVVVVGPRCHEAIRTLLHDLQSSESIEAVGGFYTSFDRAMAEVERRVASFRRDPPGSHGRG